MTKINENCTTLESVWAQMVQDVKESGAKVGSFHLSNADTDKGVKITMTYYPNDSYYSSETVHGYDWSEVLGEVRRRCDRTQTIEMKLIG